MPTEKVSLTLSQTALDEARSRVGRRGLSEFIDEALQLRLQHDRLKKLLADLDAEYGPVPEEIREEVRREWDASRPSRRRPATD